MPVKKSLKALTAPDLVKQWMKLVNEHVMMGRDSHLIHEALIALTPAQILLGMYEYRNKPTITIPMFLKQEEDWLVVDEVMANIELAIKVSRKWPIEYFTYWDNLYEEDSVSANRTIEALKSLVEFADNVLGNA